MNLFHRIGDLKLRVRLGLAFGVALVGLLTTEVLGEYVEARLTNTINEIVDDNVPKLDIVHQMSEQVHIVSRVLRTVVLLQDDAGIDAEAQKIEAARLEYDKLSDRLDKMPASEQGLEIRRKIKAARDAARPVNTRVLELARAHKDAEAVQTLLRDARPLVERWQAVLDENIEFQRQNNERDADAAHALTAKLLKVTIAVYLLIGLLVAAAAWLVTRSITQPTRGLMDTMQKIMGGDDSARANLAQKDEIGDLARVFDAMVEDRIEVQRRIQKENDTLNNSVLGLLQAVAELAKKDLTIKVPVTEDVTGAVADALNLLSGETRKVLQQVSDISADVTAASLKVKQQSDAVMGVAKVEREQVEQTAASLEATSQSMAQIAQMAQQCNAAADRAIATTQQALETVTSTVGGINSTRDTIRETEKRIKRLGERSQEISVAVSLINTIAERTHILALNAAMHAASAGEAGRGFAVVADEVQRLAESARQSTQQIAGLVGNIQVETGDTVNAMNAAITQVVEGAKLAEQAGRQMEVTQKTTAELVSSVQRIAEQSQVQARSTEALLERAAQIKKSTQETNSQLSEQSEQTNLLVDSARNLLSAVRVFKLAN